MTEDEITFPPPNLIEFPKESKKLRGHIRRYERSMRKEKEQTGMIGDGYGKRFLLGLMYMLMGDLEGALKHFEWFETECDFDGDCYQLMCWALVLLRSGNSEKVRYLFKRTMLTNLYQIPALIGLTFERQPIWHGNEMICGAIQAQQGQEFCNF